MSLRVRDQPEIYVSSSPIVNRRNLFASRNRRPSVIWTRSDVRGVGGDICHGLSARRRDRGALSISSHGPVSAFQTVCRKVAIKTASTAIYFTILLERPRPSSGEPPRGDGERGVVAGKFIKLDRPRLFAFSVFNLGKSRARCQIVSQYHVHICSRCIATLLNVILLWRGQPFVISFDFTRFPVDASIEIAQQFKRL